MGLAKAMTTIAGSVPRRATSKSPPSCAQIFTEQRTFGKSQFPFTLARPEALDYSPQRYPGTFAALDGIIVVPWNDRYTDDHVDYIANSIRDAVASLQS